MKNEQKILLNNLVSILMLAAFISICSSQDTNQLNAKDNKKKEAYIDSLVACKTIFKIGENDCKAMWGRAQSFIAKFSSVKIQTVTEFIIETYEPDYEQFGYKITKTPLTEGQYEIEVKCTESMSLMKKATNSAPIVAIADQYNMKARINERILTYYLLKSELPFPELICTK